MDNKGYVYILTNPSFKEDWVKIGKSSRPVDIRSKELDNTAVPLPFEVFATMKTSKYNEVEKHIHKTIDNLTNLRIRTNREFFNVSPQMALKILKDIAEIIDDAVIEEYNNSDYDKERKEKIGLSKPKENFNFSMIGAPVGATILFTPTNLEVRVANNNQVEYEGCLYKLSSFVETFMPESMQNNEDSSYQEHNYFTYNGEELSELSNNESSDYYDFDHFHGNNRSNRNNDKYRYNGGVYNKGEIVNVVIKDYVAQNKNISYYQLEDIFPRKIQGSCGCFDRLEKAKEIYNRTSHKRHRLKQTDLIHLSDCIIATSNQWNPINIAEFLKNAYKLGFKIKVIEL